MGDIKISCCMIVKNEEPHIEGCLRSVLDEVDEIIVVDTGSSDRTLEIASKFIPKVRIFHFRWNDDFSAARNFSLDKAEGSWILYIDADERLNTLGKRNILRELSLHGGADAYYVGIRSFHLEGEIVSGSFDWATRFFRRFPDIEFTGTIHESVEPFLIKRGALIQRAPFIIDHFGYISRGDSWRLKIERNFKLALKHIKKNPKDPYILYHLALAAYQLGKWKFAYHIIEKAYEIISSSEESRKNKLALICFILNLKAKLLLDQGKYTEAIETADKSLELVSAQKSARLLKALSYINQKQWSEAIPLLEEALDFVLREGDPFLNPSVLSMEFSVSLSMLKKLLASCYLKTGQHEKAINSLGGSDTSGLLELASLALQDGHINAAFYCLGQILRYEHSELPVHSIIPLFQNALSLTDASSQELEAIDTFLLTLASRKDWKDVLLPFLDVLISQNKTAFFIKNDTLHDIKRTRLEVLIHIRKGSIIDAIRRSFAFMRSIPKRKDLSPDEVEIVKLHAGLLVQSGKKREAIFLLKRFNIFGDAQ
ncbi:MAG: glycosyltransferase [Candidatus Micrarchaeia archaeon]